MTLPTDQWAIKWSTAKCHSNASHKTSSDTCQTLSRLLHSLILIDVNLHFFFFFYLKALKCPLEALQKQCLNKYIEHILAAYMWLMWRLSLISAHLHVSGLNCVLEEFKSNCKSWHLAGFVPVTGPVEFLLMNARNVGPCWCTVSHKTYSAVMLTVRKFNIKSGHWNRWNQCLENTHIL